MVLIKVTLLEITNKH